MCVFFCCFVSRSLKVVLFLPTLPPRTMGPGLDGARAIGKLVVFFFLSSLDSFFYLESFRFFLFVSSRQSRESPVSSF